MLNPDYVPTRWDKFIYWLATSRLGFFLSLMTVLALIYGLVVGIGKVSDHYFPPPTIGSTWDYTEEVADPFSKHRSAVTVLALKNNYVLYRSRSGAEHSSTLREFLTVYDEIPKEK